MSKQQSLPIAPIEQIEQFIYIIREHRVMLDQDLAILYQVPNKRLNEQVRRNINRFPKDFAFQLTLKEWYNLKSQFATSRSWGGKRKPPRAFTEQGVAMLSSVLKSSQAITVNIEIMRAFVRMRHVMASQQAITKELAELKSFLLKHSNSSDREFRKVWQAIEKLSTPPTKEERRIGFDTGLN
ncbi:MAG: ORF6N domain-containing protein [Patescibacteria group bacterium]